MFALEVFSCLESATQLLGHSRKLRATFVIGDEAKIGSEGIVNQFVGLAVR